MQPKRLTLRSLFLCGAMAACSLQGARAQNLNWNPFDFDAEGWARGWGIEDIVVAHDPAKDADNNANSGALMWEVPWTNGGESVLQRGAGIADLTGYSAMTVDIYVDPAMAPATNGNYGALSIRYRPNWEWPGIVFPLGTITNTGWKRYEFPMPREATNFSGMNIHWTSSYDTPARIWIDNITFVSPGLVYASFDTDTQGFPCGDWGVEHTSTFDPTLDANNSLTSGSLAVEASFTNGGEVTLQRCVGATGLTNYGLAAVDVYIDPLTQPGTSGDYGTFSLRLRPGNYEWPGEVIQLGTVTNTGWTQLRGEMPKTLEAFTAINLHWNTTFTTPTRINIDNIRFLWTAAPPPPPSISSFERSGAGLEVMTSGVGDYSRKNIATSAALAPLTSWTVSSEPVTYSMTISEDTKQHSPALSANIMLIGTESSTIAGSPDWNEPNAIILEAVQTAAGALDVFVRYKTNAPGGHGIRFQPEGELVRTNTALTSLVGTWSLTLHGTSLTMNGPGGVTGSAELPADVPALFGQNFFALFGLQPNQQTYRKVALSRVSVLGGAGFQGNLDVDFTKLAEIDSNLLETKEEEPGGVRLRPTNTLYRVSWALPDAGFSLVGAPALTSPTTTWTPVAATTVLQGKQRTAFVTDTNTAGTQFYFRLKK